MWFIMRNEDFVCENCLKNITKQNSWSVRNHCPYCLYSKHLDEVFPWDRASKCEWLMKPTWIDYKKNKWYMIIHECLKCNKTILNKTSEDDDFLDFIKLINKNDRFF